MNEPALFAEKRCPGCYQAGGTYWVAVASRDTDTWACSECNTEWTITVHIPGLTSFADN